MVETVVAKEGVAAGILGRKIGMTQLLRDDERIPVTVIQAGPCSVLQVKTAETDGYNSVQLGFDEKKPKNTSRPLLGHFAKAGASPKRFIKEFRTSAPAVVEAGDVLGVSVLEGAVKVDVQGLTKGKGWSGTIKRWNFQRQRMTHGNSLSHRMPGSQGRHYSTAKGVPKGQKMAGRLGNDKVTTIGLRVVEIDTEKNLLLVEGSVPGANGGYLVIRRSYKDASRKKLDGALY